VRAKDRLEKYCTTASERMTVSHKVLVTGAAGFIGSAVVTQLSEQGWDVVALDALLDGLYPATEKVARFEKLGALPGVERVRLNLRSGDLGTLPTGITHVINEAAMPGLGLSWQDFDLYSGCNVTALARLIEHASHWDLERFVQISTSSVYGKNAVVTRINPFGRSRPMA